MVLDWPYWYVRIGKERGKSKDLQKFNYKCQDYSLSNGSLYLVSLAGKELRFAEN